MLEGRRLPRNGDPLFSLTVSHTKVLSPNPRKGKQKSDLDSLGIPVKVLEELDLRGEELKSI